MMQTGRLLAITKYSVLEALRDRFLHLIFAGFLIFFLSSIFVGELAITETLQTQVSIFAFLLRLFCVFTLSLFVITSMIRQFNDKGFELILSQPIPRYIYLFGKLFGYLVIAIFMSFACFVCLLAYADMLSSAMWSVSLLCELLLFLTLCVLCVFTLESVTLAFSVVIGFYALSRSIEIIQLISDSPILESVDLSHRFIDWGIDILAYVIPSLHRFTQTEWLAYGIQADRDYIYILIQTFIYTILIFLAALYDLYRKEL